MRRAARTAKLSPLVRPRARGGQEARNADGTNKPRDRSSQARRDCSAAGIFAAVAAAAFGGYVIAG